MIQKDYIMRMIEQLAKFLARVLLNKNAGNNEEALSTIDSAFDAILGVDIELINALSVHNLAELLGISNDKANGSMKCIIAARLLKAKADIHEKTEKDAATAFFCYQKALSLYLEGILNLGYTELDMAGYYAGVEEIEGKLLNSMPDEIKLKMLKFRTLLEEYNKAKGHRVCRETKEKR